MFQILIWDGDDWDKRYKLIIVYGILKRILPEHLFHLIIHTVLK